MEPSVFSEEPLAKLGRLLRELNALMDSGEVDDVDLHLRYSNGGDPTEMRISCALSKVRIVGKIVREEVLGE